MKTRCACLLIAVSIILCGCSEVVMNNTALNEGETFDVWPDGYLGAEATSRGVVEPDGSDVVRLTKVTIPSMTVYPAPGDGAKPTVLVCPGGGYHILAMDLEGTEMAAWLNTQGITAVILRYRVPNNADGAFKDGQRAMSLLRYRADELNIDPERIGVMGFSAGGNLSGRLCTNFDNRQYEAIDAVDKESCRPDFAMLIYPYLLGDDETIHEFDEKINVTSETPPAIMIHTQDDEWGSASSTLYFQALTAAKVPAELHVFPTGGHGYGLRSKSEDAISSWPEVCNVWLEQFKD